MPKKYSRHSRSPRPSLTWRPIFMPRDEFNDLLRENLVVDSETMIHAANLAVRLGVAVIDALEILMRIGVLLSEENIPNEGPAD